ncbi:outer membrane protein insertion porin family [Bosea sp. OAE752]|uniref:Outer membrane protein assembly factor BamA n=1 Tax=Bosea spartocytisi TaxID=2773451 RepID=A0A927ED97_9HYPH|nr:MULTISPECIES: outer membrane protein assembly factor BamA [Bosea]MBD3848822.1 outer membrane protein assembly factor BamA [Bosea spartocytisi]MCT4471334.1 outer membrane protein assembly factor BamA [Bosea spartocytisi]
MTSTQKSRTTKTRLSRSIGLSALILAVSGGVAFAQAVVVHGNRRVDAETIRSYAVGRDNPQEIRESLLATGLFSNVQVSRRGAQTVISVQEQNGTVNRVAFEGNRRLKSDQLTPLVQSKAGGPLSQALIDSDVERLREAYRRAGYGLSSVSGRIAPLPNGRQDVVFTINESGKTGIKSINFSGNNVYSAGRLRGLMTSTESNFLSWIKTSDVYDPDRINSDLELIRRFYLKNGYADFQIVNNTARFDESAGGWVVDVQVEEGPQYKVGNVSVDSSVPGVDAARLQRYLATSTGDTYNAEAVEKSLVALTTEVNREGHAFAQVRPRGDRDASGHLIGITYVVDEGPRVYVERINVRGNTRTRDYVIRRELDLGEGDAYNKVMIDRAERRLNNLGFFNKVRVTNEPGSAPDRVVVNIDVEDKATGSFSIAGGYSTSDGMIGEVSLSESNFLGRGQFVRIAGTLGQRTQGIDFSFTEPYFLGYRVAAGFDLFSKYNDNYNVGRFQSRVTGGQVRFTFPITEEFSITPRYSLYVTNIKIPNDVSRPYNDCTNPIPGITPGTAGAVASDQLYNCVTNGEASVAVKEAQGDTLTSLVGLNFNYNSLDSVQNPRNGFIAELKPEFAGVGGDSKFLRVAADARYYREIFDDVVGFVRLQGGHVQATSGNLRMADHYFLGPTLVRGFAPSGIGPRDVLNDPTANALGGTTYFGGTLEVQFPIWGLPRDIGLRGAIFADAGTLFNYDGGTKTALGGCPAGSEARAFNVVTGGAQSSIACVRDKNVLRSSIGASILWQSPLGPIRFDYAYALSKDDGQYGLGPLGFAKYGGDRLQAFRFSGGTRF